MEKAGSGERWGRREGGWRWIHTEQTVSMFDVVSLDLHMPGMSWIETLKAIKQCQPTIEALIVTAYSDGGSVKELLELLNNVTFQ